MSRLFIAVDLSVAVVEKLAILQAEIARRLGDDSASVRWVAAPQIHVTLNFLGDVEEPVIPMLDEVLGKLVRPLFPFEVMCCRLGAFPDLGHPRILWAGLDEKGAEVMGLLRQTIEQDLGELGFAADPREYHPHVTLGRVRSVEALDMRELAGDLTDLELGTSYIKDIALFESRLGSDGPQYIVRRRFPLGEV